MPNQRIHFIITGESGSGRSLTIKRRTIRNILLVTTLFCLLLTGFSLQSTRLLHRNTILKQQVALINGDLETLITSPKLVLTQQVMILKEQVAELRLELNSHQAKESRLVETYEGEIAELRREQELLLEDSVSRLAERSRVIESLMDRIGIKVIVDETPQQSGGLFVADEEGYSERLLNNTDRYLKVLENIPLGRPVPNSISSRYGRRADPINGKKAFHEGVDFRGRTGDSIKSTGAGVIKRSTYTKGLGHHIVISHENGYETLFAHMSKRLVKRGQQVKRGQEIGLVGNTGRSTGSHLHYEIHYHGRHIDPMKFIKAANLSLTVKL